MSVSPLNRSPLAGTCDGSGACTLTIAAPSAFWAIVYIAAAVSGGTPEWTAQLSPAEPLGFGSGARVMLGPYVLQPGERASLVVAGALPGAVVSGQVLGFKADAAGEIPPLMPVTLAASQDVTTNELASLIPQKNVGQAVTLALDPTAVAVGWIGQADAASAGQIVQITIQGNKSGTLYFNSVAWDPAGGVQQTVALNALDTAVICTLVTGSSVGPYPAVQIVELLTVSPVSVVGPVRVLRGQSGVALASLQRGAGTYSVQIVNEVGPGLQLFVNVSAVVAGTVTAKIGAVDPASGALSDVLDSAALSAPALTRLRVYPGLSAAGNLDADGVLGRLIQLDMVVSGTATASLGYDLLP